MPGVVAHACNTSRPEGKVGELSQIQGQPGVYIGDPVPLPQRIQLTKLVTLAAPKSTPFFDNEGGGAGGGGGCSY